PSRRRSIAVVCFFLKSAAARVESRRWNVLARIPKRARHPNKLVQEFLHATGVSWIGNLAGCWIEELSCRAEIDIPENRDQAELAQHREQTLDHTRAAERTSRHATDPNRFVNVLLEVCIEDMF